MDDPGCSISDAVAKAKEIAARLGAVGGGGISVPEMPLNSSNGDSNSYYSAPLVGTKRPAMDNYSSGAPIEKKMMVTEKLSAAAEAAAKINEKLGGSGISHSMNSSMNPLANQVLTVIHKIPDKYVGLVIGKKGEQIITLQAESQCKVIISQEGGMPEREITMTGTQSQIEKARSMINEIVERAGGTVVGGTANLASIDVMIPGLKAGLIIGKNGETIKNLQESTGAKMVLIQESNTPSADDKPLRITGDPESVDKAKNMVIALLANKDGKPMPRIPQAPTPENADSCVYGVPVEKAGLVIGKGGETVREICSRSGAFVEISKQQSPDPGLKLFNIRGQRHEIDNAIRLISERAGIPVGPPQSYIPGGGGHMMNYQQQQGGYNSWPGYSQQQQGQWSNQGSATAVGQNSLATAASGTTSSGLPAPTINPQTGQPDYSAAWAEYYRRQNMHEHADMILRQAQQNNPAFNQTAQQAAVPAAAPAAQQYDYSQQWYQWQQQQQVAAPNQPIQQQHWNQANSAPNNSAATQPSNKSSNNNNSWPGYNNASQNSARYSE